MKNLKDIILEKLIINKNTKMFGKSYITPDLDFFYKKNEDNIKEYLFNSGYNIDDVDEKYRYKTKDGKPTLFWKAWVTAALYGPLVKKKLIEKINELQGVTLDDARKFKGGSKTEKWKHHWEVYEDPEHNTTAFANWMKQNRFTSKGMKVGIIPNKQDEWNI